MSGDLVENLEARLPKGVRLALRDPRLLYPMGAIEQTTIKNAVPKRQREFSAGRDAARACLAGFGCGDADMSVASNRAPIWPDGFTGSITHCDTLCLAAVGRLTDIISVGLDVEDRRALPKELHDIVLHAEDRAAFKGNEILVFSAKEAIYKALAPHIPDVLEFHDLALHCASEGKVNARLLRDTGPFASGFEVSAHYVSSANHIASLCWLTAGDTPC